MRQQLEMGVTFKVHLRCPVYCFPWVLQFSRIAKLETMFLPMILLEEYISDLNHNSTQYTSTLK